MGGSTACCQPKDMFKIFGHITEMLNNDSMEQEIEPPFFFFNWVELQVKIKNIWIQNTYHLTGFMLNSRRQSGSMSHSDFPAM